MRRAGTLAVLTLVALAAALATPAEARRRLQRPKASLLRPRIVNGIFTAVFPSTGLLLAGDDTDSASASCSGTLIGCNTFLTAAHCVCDTVGPDCQGAGAPDPSQSLVFLQHAGFFAVSNIAVHPDYDFPVADVAVLTLGAPVNGVAPTPINETLPLPGLAGTIVGFGRSGGVSYDYGLKRVGNVTTAACSGGVSDLTSLCWDFTGVGANTCNGDSGGPLFLDLGSGPVVAGITSGGDSGSCLPTDHSYDVNVAHYAPYIQGVAGSDLEATSCGSLDQAGAAGTAIMSAQGTLSSVNISRTHAFPVTAGSALLRVTMNAVDDGPSDFDLYVRAGSPPTTTTYDCKQDGGNQYGACSFASPAAGPWYVMVRRFSGAGAYQLTATAFGTPAPTCGNAVWESGEACEGAENGSCPGACAGDCTCLTTCGEGDLHVDKLRIARSVTLRATVPNVVGVYAGIDPRLSPLAVTLDDGVDSSVLAIPADDPGWSRSRPDRGVYKWRGKTGPLRRLSLRFDGVRWDLRLAARDVPNGLLLDPTAVDVALAFGDACAQGAP
jgi:hypothetical protein